MYKKLFVTAVLCLGLLVMLGTEEAKAWPRVGGWGLHTGSVTCESFWKAVGNPDVNYASVQCELNIVEVQLQCINNGGGTGGLGNPFEVYANIIGDQLITPGILVSKGKAWSEITFTDLEIYDALFCYEYVDGECIDNDYVFPADICQNPNWSVVPPKADGTGGTILVTRTGVILRGFATNNNGEVILTDEVEGMCTITDEYDLEGNRLYYCE